MLKIFQQSDIHTSFSCSNNSNNNSCNSGSNSNNNNNNNSSSSSSSSSSSRSSSSSNSGNSMANNKKHSNRLESSSDLCPICLTAFDNPIRLSQNKAAKRSKEKATNTHIAILPNCGHYFCQGCIIQWSKLTNTCPIDRIQFNSVHIKTSIHGTIVTEIEVEDVRQHDSSLIEYDLTSCEICQQSDREDVLLLCDGCNKGYHIDCLVPPLFTIPMDIWYCQDCHSNLGRAFRWRRNRFDVTTQLTNSDFPTQLPEFQDIFQGSTDESAGENIVQNTLQRNKRKHISTDDNASDNNNSSNLNSSNLDSNHNNSSSSNYNNNNSNNNNNENNNNNSTSNNNISKNNINNNNKSSNSDYNNTDDDDGDDDDDDDDDSEHDDNDKNNNINNHDNNNNNNPKSANAIKTISRITTSPTHYTRSRDNNTKFTRSRDNNTKFTRTLRSTTRSYRYDSKDCESGSDQSTAEIFDENNNNNNYNINNYNKRSRTAKRQCIQILSQIKIRYDLESDYLDRNKHKYFAHKRKQKKAKLPIEDHYESDISNRSTTSVSSYQSNNTSGSDFENDVTNSLHTDTLHYNYSNNHKIKLKNTKLKHIYSSTSTNTSHNNSKNNKKIRKTKDNNIASHIILDANNAIFEYTLKPRKAKTKAAECIPQLLNQTEDYDIPSSDSDF